MAKRRFGVTLTVDTVFEFDDAVFSEQQLRDAAECLDGGGILDVDAAVQHLAYNMVANQIPISLIDGFANLPDEAAKCEGWNGGDWDIQVTELEP